MITEDFIMRVQNLSTICKHLSDLDSLIDDYLNTYQRIHLLFMELRPVFVIKYGVIDQYKC
jgi:hypothetical protein